MSNFDILPATQVFFFFLNVKCAGNVNFQFPQVNYQAALREAHRLLHDHAEKLQQGKVTKDGCFDEDLHRAINARVGVLLHKMSGEITQECQRLGSWGVLGQGTGGQLVYPGTRDPVPRDDLIGKFLKVFIEVRYIYI